MCVFVYVCVWSGWGVCLVKVRIAFDVCVWLHAHTRAYVSVSLCPCACWYDSRVHGCAKSERAHTRTHFLNAHLHAHTRTHTHKHKHLHPPTDPHSLVKALIKGEREDAPASFVEKKGWLFDIVANKRNSVDVDKFDYLVRHTEIQIQTHRRTHTHTHPLCLSLRVYGDLMKTKHLSFSLPLTTYTAS